MCTLISTELTVRSKGPNWLHCQSKWRLSHFGPRSASDRALARGHFGPWKKDRSDWGPKWPRTEVTVHPFKLKEKTLLFVTCSVPWHLQVKDDTRRVPILQSRAPVHQTSECINDEASASHQNLFGLKLTGWPATPTTEKYTKNKKRICFATESRQSSDGYNTIRTHLCTPV